MRFSPAEWLRQGAESWALGVGAPKDGEILENGWHFGRVGRRWRRWMRGDNVERSPGVGLLGLLGCLWLGFPHGSCWR